MARPKKETADEKAPATSKLPFKRPTDTEYCDEVEMQGKSIAKLKVKMDRSRGLALADKKEYDEAVASLVEYSQTRGAPRLADGK